MDFEFWLIAAVLLDVTEATSDTEVLIVNYLRIRQSLHCFLPSKENTAKARNRN